MINIIFKVFKYLFLLFTAVISFFLIYTIFFLTPKKPLISNGKHLNSQIQFIDTNIRVIKNNWLRKNKNGWIEVYIEGDPYERGVYLGKLSKDMLYQQEKVFVDQIRRLVPGETYIRFLQLFLRFFNRTIFKNFPIEYQLEILGESESAPKEFDYIGDAFERMIYYHGAHDIGHALQGLALVGCTSFAAQSEKTKDGKLIIGRNFDFYVGDEFANQKEIVLCNPNTGNKFVIITWPGFIGCVSGMNEKGITVTLNAAKSDVPTNTATPIAILAREILQYASTTNDAWLIANKYQTFVSESILIGSSKENRSFIIEKTPTQIDTFSSLTNVLKCTNHYQGKLLSKSTINLENIKNSASNYRMNRLNELMNNESTLTQIGFASILRDRSGLNSKDIGMGNEKALNQLICHHSVIFKPNECKMWISTDPYQLGFYECYDFTSFFNNKLPPNCKQSFIDTIHRIPEDSFLKTTDWKKYLQFKNINLIIKKSIHDNSKILSNDFLNNYLKLNPEYYYSYELVGDYYCKFEDPELAILNYKKALSKEVNSLEEVKSISAKIKKIK